MQQTCGNCGQLVGVSDITCRHCGVLLAAYASPYGVSPADWSAPTADAVAPGAMEESPSAIGTDIPDTVGSDSTALRPLLAADLTIENLKNATGGDNDAMLPVVHEDEAASTPVVFNSLNHTRLPFEAEPVPVIEGADTELIAGPSDENATAWPPAEPEEPEPAVEIVPRESRHGDAPTAERAGFWKDFPINNYDEGKRSHTIDYLREVDEEAILACLPKWMTKHLETSQLLADESSPGRQDKPWIRWENEDGEPTTIMDLVSTILFIVVFALEANNSIGFDALMAVTLLLMFLPLISSLWKSWTRQ